MSDLGSSSLTRRRALAAGLGVLAAPALALAQSGLRLRLGHALPPSHPVHPAMERFAEIVRERTAGAIEIQLFADGQIGQELDLLEQARAGKLDLVKASASVLEKFAKPFGVFNLPFLIRDKAHWRAIVTGPVGEALLATGEPSGLIGLTFYDAGARSFYGQRRIDHPDDLKGLKIRVQPSPSMIRMMRLFGAEPAPMHWDVVYGALRSKLIDGAENSLAALVYGRHGEVISHYSFTEHTMVPDVFLVGARTWQRLDPSQRTIFQEAARLSFERMDELWTRAEADAKAWAESVGVSFSRPDKRPFMERVAPMRDEIGDDALVATVRRIDQV